MTQEELIVFNKAVKQIKEKNITFQVVFVVKYLDNFYLLCKKDNEYWILEPKNLD